VLKDGASAIYGADAVAGVVNLITRKSVDRPELTVDANLPFESGGSRFNLSGATGWNFDSGNIVAAFQYYQMQPLQVATATSSAVTMTWCATPTATCCRSRTARPRAARRTRAAATSASSTPSTISGCRPATGATGRPRTA